MLLLQQLLQLPAAVGLLMQRQFSFSGQAARRWAIA